MLPTFRRAVSGLGALLSIGLAACDLSVDPGDTAPPIDLEIDFCSNDVPVWFAYQNIGESTTRVLPDAQATFRFSAKSRVVIGMVWQMGADYHTEFIYASNEELTAISGRACAEDLGTKTVNGTIAGIAPTQLGVIGMGIASAPLANGNTSYSLTSLPDRPLDLIATRQNLSGMERLADRVVLRRAQNFANNASVPAIDFAGTESVAAATASATVSGIFTGEFAYLNNEFLSQLGTAHSLLYVENIGNGTRQFSAIPAASLAIGEYHTLTLVSVNPDDASLRSVQNYFFTAGNQTLALGPSLEVPNIGTIPNAEYVRLRASLPTQTSYDDAIQIDYSQQQSASVTSMRIWATLGWLRQVVNTWVIDVPDLSGADGWQDAWGLKPGFPIDWVVTGYGGKSTLLFGALPDAGDFVRFAVQQSQPDPAVAALRAPAPRRTARPFQRPR
ncbi:MAG TPA: hypothetical protein VEB19_05775 [Gemmatimonadaceae bacterium]|nr:hypothetical protein [Gemmatimonadaceae bacterium]